MNRNPEGENYSSYEEMMWDEEETRISEQNEQIFQMTRNDY